MTLRPLVLAALAVAGLLAPASPAQAASAFQILKVQYDSPGADTGSNLSLNNEYVVIKNTSPKTYALTGWRLRDAAGHVYVFPKTVVAGGAKIVVHTGKGTNQGMHRYWQKDWYVWNNTGDKAVLRRPDLTVADTCAWNGGSTSVTC